MKPKIIKFFYGEVINPLLLPTPIITKTDIKNLNTWIDTYDSIDEDTFYDIQNLYPLQMTLAWAHVHKVVNLNVWMKISRSFDEKTHNNGISELYDSVLFAVYDAYYCSFVDEIMPLDFSPLWYLWNRGLVPSFDGNNWNLHSGKDAKIVYRKKVK
jgi:hypothetical protein